MSPRPDADLEKLHPHFRAQVRYLLQQMEDAGRPGRVFEAFRSDERQAALYAIGRTVPGRIVTKAANGLRTVHRYGLAVDIVHPTLWWSAPDDWWEAMYEDAAQLGLTVGGRWPNFPDPPHIQTGLWPAAPPRWARDWLREQPDNLARIWERLGT